MSNWLFQGVISIGLSFFICSSSLYSGFQDNSRVHFLADSLPLNGIGLEIAPFYRPTLLKREANIFYTDYTTAADLIGKHKHLEIAQQIAEEIVELDFIWRPGAKLIDCIPRKMRFDYAIASHVIEHVPNVIGWLIQILDVLKPGGVLSLAIPDKRYTFDAYRPETHVCDVIDTWLRDVKVPTAAQIYDMLSNAVDVPPGSLPLEEEIPFETLHRNYTDQQALEFAIHAFKTGAYLDIHCSVFTPESLKMLLLKLHELGILNVSVSEPMSCGSEFFIRLTKLGEPRIKHP